MLDPREPNLTIVKRILHYLWVSLDFGLLLRCSATTELVIYTNADWASCLVINRSTMGYVVFYGDNLVSWSSKHQNVITHSSTEVEYRTVANGVAKAC
jgi:hypothetical protein